MIIWLQWNFQCVFSSGNRQQKDLQAFLCNITVVATVAMTALETSHKNSNLSWKPWSQCYEEGRGKQQAVLTCRQVLLFSDLLLRGNTYQWGTLRHNTGAPLIEWMPVLSLLLFTVADAFPLYHNSTFIYLGKFEHSGRLNSTAMPREPIYMWIVASLRTRWYLRFGSANEKALITWGEVCRRTFTSMLALKDETESSFLTL